MAALQLGEEIREIHGEALPWFDMHIFATGAGKAALLSRRIQNPEI
jgi:predicted ATPase